MATYNEIYTSISSQTFEPLRQKVWVAVLVKAKSVLNDANAPADRLTWAKNAFVNTDYETESLMRNVIGGSVASAISAMASVADSVVQTAINNAVDVLYPAA